MNEQLSSSYYKSASSVETEKWAFWFYKPVAVQFKQPYVICGDVGPREVTTVDSEGAEKVCTYGTPALVMGGTGQQRGPMGVPVATGELYPDPQHPERLIMEVDFASANVPAEQLPKVIIAVDPNNIEFITVIPEHKPPSKLVTPKKGLVTP